ncbi:uncharacterized protein HMPREF1541_06138 [Cyphellophora europaea CBS 101466]|uniref:WW domain-containing protein n=1 Tax=Cyphellophora europaea (strain CBS 101466) TaxID=1220924 RepID=W2RTU9_CYPE1|nr:uncharacterized protein HMPREF1541_06138 [Cyphellophora europaea CBS 101466]ETN39911.1 hypothetical protein HMPREF1541_06138 [Cyphellophora europaea CBS 101466]
MLKSTHKKEGLLPSSSLPEGWTEHTAPSGHKYYYNASTKQSTYTRPALEPPASSISQDEPLFAEEAAPDPVMLATLRAQEEFSRNNAGAGQQQTGHFTGGKSYQQRPPRKGHGGDRPKKKKEIPGQEPWVLVYTRFGRRFVHNTETKESLWKFPQEVMMGVIEMEAAEWKKKQEQDKTQDLGDSAKETKTAEPGGSAAQKAATHEPTSRATEERHDRGGYESSDYEEVEVTDDEDEAGDADGTNKRARLAAEQEPTAPTGPAEMTEDDIAWQLAQMEADDGDDAYDDYDDYDVDNDVDGEDGDANPEDGGLEITPEDNIFLFRSLLDETHISPYATFDSLLTDPRLIDDSRWVALPNMASRKDVFASWSRDRVAAEKERRAAEPQRKEDPRETYLRFLGDKASTKLFWPEFKRKFKREEIMKAYEPTEKEREKLYREFVGKLKLPGSTRRKELGELLKGLQKGADVQREVVRDVRYWAVEAKERNEMVSAWMGT